jgi:hypothetical protein
MGAREWKEGENTLYLLLVERSKSQLLPQHPLVLYGSLIVP